MKSIGSTNIFAGMKTATGFCAKHGEFTSVTFAGRNPECGECGKEKRERDLLETQQETERTRKLASMQIAVRRSGIPDRFRSKTFADYQADCEGSKRALRICQAYAQRFDDRYEHGGGLVLCGNPGTGKTHLSAAICNEVMSTGRTALFVGVIAAIRRVKETYRNSNETEREAIGHFVTPDLLVLDEVGLQFGTESETLILSEIINERYERVKPTILISNLPEQELANYVGPRVMDRMREGGGVVLPFDWKSKRSEIKTASRDMPAWVQA